MKKFNRMIILFLYIFYQHTFSQEPLEEMAAFEYLHPQHCLYQIELLGKQMQEDLQLLGTRPHGLNELNDTDYMIHQAEQIFNLVQRLVQEESKTHLYLPDDIAYLIDIMKELELKLMHTIPVTHTKIFGHFVNLCDYIARSKKQLEQFLKHSNEQIMI